jgi:hypothetical protein
MNAIGFELPEEVISVRDGVMRFVEAEVLPLERNYALPDDPRRVFAQDGRYAPEVHALIREVRMASATAGFYAMCAPASLGGGGLGHLAYYVAWEAIHRRLGRHAIVTPWVIAHWAFGPSAVLTQMTQEARTRCLGDMLEGAEKGRRHQRLCGADRCARVPGRERGAAVRSCRRSRGRAGAGRCQGRAVATGRKPRRGIQRSRFTASRWGGSTILRAVGSIRAFPSRSLALLPNCTLRI